MRVRPLLSSTVLLAAACALFPARALAKDGKPLTVTSGKRTALDSAQPLPIEELAPPPGDDDGKAKSHMRGRRPRTPKSQLPEGVPLSEPNAKARASIAEGPTAEEVKLGAQDSELIALRSAEKVLFPRQVRGLSANWSFELPAAPEHAERTLGLPLSLGESEPVESYSKEDIEWLRTLTLPDLPVRLDRRVVTYLKFYRDSHRGRTIAAIWTRKSGRYVAEMKAKLRRAGLPTDLVWLSMIESGHNPTIRSPAGAVGLWQFMPESGRMYGLTVDRWVDERRDPARSTQAAIRFLSDLHQRFGNWELAMGAYNMGYAGMSRAVAKYNTNDYWALSRMESGIPWETTLYVPKIFALAIVMNNRQAFGVGRQKLDPSEAFDTVLLEPATPLSKIAKAAGVDEAEIKEMNPQYLAGRLPPQTKGKLRKWAVRVPSGAGKRTLGALAKAGAKKLQTHQVRLGDTIANVAQLYGVRRSSLERQNALSKREVLTNGTVLLLPTGSKRVKQAARPEVVVSRHLKPAENQRRVFYEVRDKDQLSEIAQAFGVTEADLGRWNVLNTGAYLRAGMTLQVLVPKSAALNTVRFIEEKGARILLAGSPEFHEHFEGLKGKRRVQITVAAGDTLAKIGARHGMSVGSMERVNRRSRRTKLIPGERLIVYTERKATASKETDAAQPSPLEPIVAPRPDLLP